MKTRQWTSLAVAAAALIIGSSCSHDWGQADPPAGNQINPTLENVATYSFDDELGLDPILFKLHNYEGGAQPELVQDDEKGQVLSLDNGYVSIANPLNAVKVQKAVSFTFWMKQPVVLDEEGNPVDQDLTGALIAFENQPGTVVLPDSTNAGAEPVESVYGKMYFTANGMINYDATDGDWYDNNPADYKSGYLVPGEWHYVAVIVRNDGYGIYIDGDRKVDKVVPGFDCSKIVNFMNHASTLYIGYGADDATRPWLIDDLNIYRNEITAKEIKRPGIGGAGGEDLTKFEYVVGDPIYNIGTPDCSAAWWTEFSNYYRIPVETTMRFKFVNHTSGGGNWNNWNLCVSTDADRGAGDYEEYFVIRSDLYGWGGAYNGDNWSNTGYGDWDQFRKDMEGAIVDVVVERLGAEVNVTATATAKNGTVYIERFHATCGNGKDVIRAFFIVDGSYLEFQKTGCVASWPVAVEKANIGTPDCSAAWWTEFSDYFKIPVNMSLHLGFVNHTSGGGNWNNWNLCVSTDDERGGGDYEEYFVIRSDLYGWGGAYNGDNWSNTGYGDWDQFRKDMEGAYVGIDIVRAAENVAVTATATAKNGTVYIEKFNANCGNGKDVLSSFLIVDGSYLEMRAADCYTYFPIYK